MGKDPAIVGKLHQSVTRDNITVRADLKGWWTLFSEGAEPEIADEDKEFIAQMAQFSTLEQIMGMGEEISKLSNLMNYSQALSLLGKTVRINTGEESITGIVKELSRDLFSMSQ